MWFEQHQDKVSIADPVWLSLQKLNTLAEQLNIQQGKQTHARQYEIHKKVHWITRHLCTIYYIFEHSCTNFVFEFSFFIVTLKFKPSFKKKNRSNNFRLEWHCKRYKTKNFWCFRENHFSQLWLIHSFPQVYSNS